MEQLPILDDLAVDDSAHHDALGSDPFSCGWSPKEGAGMRPFTLPTGDYPFPLRYLGNDTRSPIA